MNLYWQFSISKQDSRSRLAFSRTSTASTRVVRFGFGRERLTQTLWVVIKTHNISKSVQRSVSSLIHKKRTCQAGSMRRADDSLIHLLSSAVCGQIKTLSAISNTDIFCKQAETSTDGPHGGNVFFFIKSTSSGCSICAACMHISQRPWSIQSLENILFEWTDCVRAYSKPALLKAVSY